MASSSSKETVKRVRKLAERWSSGWGQQPGLWLSPLFDGVFGHRRQYRLQGSTSCREAHWIGGCSADRRGFSAAGPMRASHQVVRLGRSIIDRKPYAACMPGTRRRTIDLGLAQAVDSIPLGIEL